MILDQKIHAFKRKYYLNQLVRGGIFASSVMLASFLLINIFEYFGNFNTPMRAMLFYSFVLTAGVSLWVWVLEPLTRLMVRKRQLSDMDAAKQIGGFFPQVEDKLLNTLQLLQVQAGASSDLVQASIAQKADALAQYEFEEAIDISYNRRYLKYLLIPFFIILGVFLYKKDFFAKSTERIVYYNQAFEPEAPFRFVVPEQSLTAFKNEDFELSLQIEGAQVPADVHIVTEDGRRLKMGTESVGKFLYTFKKLQKSVEFRLEAAGFQSKHYKLNVLARPSLQGFTVYLDYPAYVGKKDERLGNTGNLIVPEGTQITWSFRTEEAAQLAVAFQGGAAQLPAKNMQKNAFEVSHRIFSSDTYEVLMQNEHSKNAEKISYFINVVKDEHPSIALQQFQDTVLYDYLMLGGNIGDDYGITALNMKYQIVPEGKQAEENAYRSASMPFNANVINQSFFYRMELDSLQLKDGDRIEYYVEVWDNDGVNGRKRTKTLSYAFKMPSSKEIKEEMVANTNKAEDELEEVLKQSRELNEQMKELQDRLKGKRELDWQDKKALENMVQKHQELTKTVEQMQQNQELLQEKMQKFGEMSPELAEKAEQLQQLMDELLDEETKQMYEELNQLLNENMLDKELLEKLEKLDFSQKNMEQELERSVELFKKLKFDMKNEQLAKDLHKLAEKEEKLAEETEKAKESELDELQKQQEGLNEEFKQLKEEMKELEKLNQELAAPKDLDMPKEQMDDIQKDMQEGKQQMEQKQQKQASEKQQKAAEKMEELAKQLEQMQQTAEMEQMTEDYDALRQILENLVTLSFDQEKLMKDFKAVRRTDPKFLDLSQQQLKLKADAKIIEDSLISLSKRVFQIESFVTREIGLMNAYMNDAIEIIKSRPPDVAPATASKQQFAMTSINNLALMLSDILRQMQEQMSSGMGGKQMNEKKGNMPSMSELQQQLNQQIEQLKKSGKTGRQLSEELAKLAMQQEMIRRAIQAAKQQGAQPGGMPGGGMPGGGQGGKPGEEGKPAEGGKNGQDGKNGQGGDGGMPLEKLMEETEKDLVNKRITAETLKRQQQILTRLLESEKAMRERELEQQRRAETAKGQYKRESPQGFSEYLKNKEKQIELLKTIPPALNPYYKQEVNEYFKKVGGQ